MKIRLRKYLWGLVASSLIMANGAIAENKRHILLIIADDVGYDTVNLADDEVTVDTARGSVALPALSMLAKGGCRFTNAYAHPACTPTRASIYTGLNPWRSGAPHPTDHDLPTTDATTLAELTPFEQEFHCYLAGKWHLGDDEAGQPLKHGWGSWYGHVESQPEDNYMDWIKYGRTNHTGTLVTDANMGNDVQDPTTITSRYAPGIHKQHVLDWINQFGKKSIDRDLFITYSCSLAHSPFHDPKTGVSSGDNTADFAAMVKQMDDNIMEILQALDTIGELDWWRIIFIGDNGTPSQIEVESGVYGEKTKLTKRGLQVPLIQVDGQFLDPNGDGGASTITGSAGTEYPHLVHATDLFKTIGESWMAPTAATGLDSENFLGKLKGNTTSGEAEPLGRGYVFSQWGGVSGKVSQSAWLLNDSAGTLWRLYHDAEETENSGFQLFNVDTDDYNDVYASADQTVRDLFVDPILAQQQLQSDGSSVAFPTLPAVSVSSETGGGKGGKGGKGGGKTRSR